jgi:hypothetical protein
MPNSTYLPVSESNKLIWLKNFGVKLPLYGTLFGLLPADLTSATNDTAMVAYALDQDEFFKKETAKRVSYKNLLCNGEIGSILGAYPVTAVIPAPPVAVAPGVYKRVAKLVQRIKNNVSYTVAIGEDLGIEAHAGLFAAVLLKPELTVTKDAGHPLIKWKKGDTSALDLYVDRGDGKGFILLLTAIQPHYTDMFPLPTTATSALWTYKGIYKTADAQAGEFSNPVGYTVSHTV